MQTPVAINVCVIQPVGYVHGLGLLDPARYFQHQLRKLGAKVSLSKNRLQHNAVNFVFGAHLGFDPELRNQYTCIFVNLEQIGDRGAQLTPAYLQLLQTSAVVDYDAANVAGYCHTPEDVPLVSFGHAGYLSPIAAVALPLAERPIDLLFFGSLNERRRAMIERIEATGRTVTLFDGPVYGPERDLLIASARAVLNCHFYDSARFEQVRAFQCLSLGTPVVSERTPNTRPAEVYDTCVTWFDGDQLEPFFRDDFMSQAYLDVAQAQLACFSGFDPVDAFAEVLAFAAGVRAGHAPTLPSGRQLVRRLHLGSGKDYRPGWFNVDLLPGARPDAVIDLAQPHQWPLDIDSSSAGPVRLAAGEVQLIYANNVLEHVPDLPALMTQCLELLAVGGEFRIDVPYEHSPGAWQDPTHVRAMNENSWLYYTDWFWYLGWFEQRFHLGQFVYLDLQLNVCPKEQAHFMRVHLVKAPTTIAEKMIARTMRADFGGVPDTTSESNDDDVIVVVPNPAARVCPPVYRAVPI